MGGGGGFDFLLLTQRRPMSRWHCLSMCYVMCLQLLLNLFGKSAFYIYRMLKLMPHWKCFSFRFVLVLTPINKAQCNEWDRYVENAKWGVSYNIQERGFLISQTYCEESDFLSSSFALSVQGWDFIGHLYRSLVCKKIIWPV